MLEQRHHSSSGGESETPIKSTLVDAKPTSNRVTRSQAAVELDLPLFGDMVLFPELLTFRLAHPLAWNRGGRVFFPFDELRAGRVELSRTSDRHGRRVEEGNEERGGKVYRHEKS